MTSIRLYMNEIGDEGAAALVRAALSGAVPGLKSISLDPHVESTGPIGISLHLAQRTAKGSMVVKGQGG